MSFKDKVWDAFVWVLTFKWLRKDKSKNTDKWLDNVLRNGSIHIVELNYVRSFQKAIKTTLKKLPEGPKKELYKKIFNQLLKDEKGLLLLKGETDNLLKVLFSLDFMLERVGVNYEGKRNWSFWNNTRIIRKRRINPNVFRKISVEKLINYAKDKFDELIKITKTKRDLIITNNKVFSDALNEQFKRITETKGKDEAEKQKMVLNAIDKNNKKDKKQQESLDKMQHNIKVLLGSIISSEKLFQENKLKILFKKYEEKNLDKKFPDKKVSNFVIASVRNHYGMGVWIFQFLGVVTDYFKVIHENLEEQRKSINDLRNLANMTKINEMEGVNFNFDEQNIAYVVNGLNKTQQQDAQSIWNYTTGLMDLIKGMLIKRLEAWKDIKLEMKSSIEEAFKKFEEITGFDIDKHPEYALKIYEMGENLYSEGKENSLKEALKVKVMDTKDASDTGNVKNQAKKQKHKIEDTTKNQKKISEKKPARGLTTKLKVQGGAEILVDGDDGEVMPTISQGRKDLHSK